jgi:two-component system, NtrC family, sensor histidine kinase PilS
MTASSDSDPWLLTSQAAILGASGDTPQGGPNEFERLWRAFMTARATLGLVLVLLQATLIGMGLVRNPTLLLVCGAYLAATLVARFLFKARQLGRNFDPMWALIVGVDLLTFSMLQVMQGGGINYAALMALPVLLAAVLGSLFLAMGTAASVSLLLLAHSFWLASLGTFDATPQLAQSALVGAGCFVIAFLSNRLSTRLSQEESRAHQSLLAVQVQRQVNELVIESLSDGIVVVDANGNVLAANPAARQMLGVDLNALPQTFNLKSEPAWSGLDELATASFNRNELRRTDISMRNRGQGQRRLRVRTRQTGLPGSPQSSLCVMFLQDQREMEARMRTEKLASMGRMSAAVAHEIRNPLAAISQANALLEEDSTDPRQRQLIDMVAQNANRLGKIVDEVLNISRIQTREVQNPPQSLALGISINQVAVDWAQQTASQNRLRIDAPSPDIVVAFEPEHLRRVLVNLLDNARRYATGQAESIQIFAQQNERRQGTLVVWSDGPPLEQSVEDHLFEPFFSSESRSTGLGLYICRELCEGHGAVIIYRRTSRTKQGKEASGNEFVITFRTARTASQLSAAVNAQSTRRAAAT